MNRTRASLSIAAIVAAAVVLGTSPARAIYCSNCGTEWTQIANNLELIEQLAQQAELVRQGLLNTKALTEQEWSAALADIRKLTALLAQAKSLSFAKGDLEGQFAEKFGDFQGYVAKDLKDEALGAKYQQWSEETNASVLTTLKAAGLQSEQMEGSEDAYLRQLEGLTESAEGRMQALQVGNQIAITTARQMQKLRQLVLMELQLKANDVQTQMDRDAAQTSAWRNFTKQPQAPANSGKRY